ncbi:uncharacterized protein LOC127714001 [Mytilus californianus]|uniref:uncharacterized protein LOC127714001 n=1 Tax=Mytilus californianus TaxID=6549 RepID=UPI0022469F44|nr:uncharacterized protein LOC127714001 [Mytilus californianus]
MTDFIICLFFALLVHRAVCLKFKGGDFILLDNEPENLLYENTFVYEWRLCRVNSSVISPNEYDRKGYINENCFNKNWDNKHPCLKFAWFYAGVPFTEVPTCDPLSAADSYIWNCEKDLLPNEVTPYRNCTPVCNEGYTLLQNVTTRCSVHLTWTWFGDKDKQFCEKTHLEDFTQPPSDRFPITTVSEKFPSSTVSERYPSTTISEGPSNTVSTVSVSSNEIVWTLSGLTASHINETALELTWKVSISPAGSHHYPNGYNISYNKQGEQTHHITLKGYLLNTTISELEPDTKYFFKLCAKGTNERDEICANTTVQTKAKEVLVGKQSPGDDNTVILIGIVAGCGVLLVFFAVIIICMCKKQRYSPSSSSSSDQYSLVGRGTWYFYMQN